DVTENYAVTLNPGTLTITKASLAVSVTANSDSKVYTGSEQTVTGYQTPVGLLAGHTLSGITASGSGTNVGTYPVTFTGTPVIKDGNDVDVTENYAVTLNPGTLTITTGTGADLSITDYSGVYDAVGHSIIVSGIIAGDTVTYKVGEGEWSTTNPSYTNVGVYTVDVKITNPNYADRTGSGNVEITKAPVMITVEDASKAYGAGDPEFTGTVEGLLGNDSIGTVIYSRIGSEENVGTYNDVLTASYTENPNYLVTVNNGDFTITDVFVEIPVTKIWIDSLEEPQYDQPMFRAQSVQRPESIELHLVDENGDGAASITIEPDEYNNWSGTFVLRKYDGNNNVIDYSNYTIEEETLENYISIVENWGSDGFGVYNIEAIKVPVTKVWEGPEGDEVTITLIDANGEPTEHTVVLNDKSNWEGSFKLPKFEKVDEVYYRLNYYPGYELVDYSKYTVSESEVVGYETDIIGSIEDGFTVTNTIKNVSYTINYLELGTNLPVADTVTKSGIYGSDVTENAINVNGYNKVGQTEKTITLDLNGNVINFYYSKHQVIEDSDFHVINWMYETGYNTDAYNKRYTTDGEGSVTETQIANYVQLHYDSDYTYIRREISSNTVETIVVIDVTTGSAITGSAVTGSGIKLVTTTVVDLYYDRNGGGGGGGGGTTITDPVVPLADLEKLDHFAYVIGYPEGDVRPLNNITREEVAMIFYRLLTDESRNNLLSDSNPFTDLENHGWSNRAISTLFNAGIIKGYPDGTFKPSDPISRAEFATIAAKFDKLDLGSTSKFTDIFGHWAEKYITSSEIKGWIKGYPDLTFKPEQDITRAEAMTLINNVLERLVPEENIHPDAMFWPDSTSDKWYFEAVMEATNSHDYIYEEDGDELWTGMKSNKVWP
ncbi:S-layer homology domain-containing protein, partial [Sedimentibacter saalensis]|uniref:S-layer homology domain-containing protein n=1 Tax=Sedimentibacter saalensis TaxID=130788 RepID=UPI0028A0EF67